MKEDTKVTIKNLPSFTLAQASSIAEKEKTRLNPPSEEDLAELEILLKDFGLSKRHINNVIKNEVTKCKNMHEFEALRRTLINKRLNKQLNN